jgi:hypothetical protein
VFQQKLLGYLLRTRWSFEISLNKYLKILFKDLLSKTFAYFESAIKTFEEKTIMKLKNYFCIITISLDSI